MRFLSRQERVDTRSQTGSLKDMFCQFFPFLFHYRISLRNPWAKRIQRILGLDAQAPQWREALLVLL